ncbi:plasmid replication initiator TrfA [Arsenophonus nasoniae]|uniref:Plasmid replication initiator TrfA n=1 Tax=Arsenophonus nasoniae TaxID=638 RepID=A0ABY8NYR6_9GAMM|nr:plasmid replication initiator TrfA [Arsenophonus nasoniae]WGM08996.1 plasmid replication initiator TrfA [Arsenophonus nasoniae]
MKNIWDQVDNIAKIISKKKEENHVEKQQKSCFSTEGNNSDNEEKNQKIETNEEIYLPISKQSNVPVPNGILRSALFGIVAKGKRKFEKSLLKATVNGYSVKYTGEQLDQSDLDVWLECLRRCQNTPLGHIVRCSSYDFLKTINRRTGKSDYEWLKSVFLRLRVNDIEISDGKYTYAGSLVFEHFRDENTGENCIILNPKIASCFSDSCWTGIDRTIRLQLKGKPLTQWLYSFYASHAKPFPIKLDTIHQLCGSNSTIKEYKRLLKKALLELSDVTGWSCKLDETNKVIVNKK